MSINESCNCGETGFSIAREISAKLARCTCSFCAKTNMLQAYYATDRWHSS
ncbi:hypothetical protein [Actimicrobium antarcticum]|uniref:hypothetical protein n=1 Tax=Actimicrobium antarcticum TaxID=1051899 RepID=UPI0031D7D614